MEPVRLIISIVIITFIGWNILYPVLFRRERFYLLEEIFIAYGLGFGFVSLEMLLFYFFKIEFSLNKIITPWMALLLVNSIIYFKDKRTSAGKAIDIKDGGSRALKVFLILGITFEILYALFRALVKPIESYDAVAIYAIKAKIFYLAKSIPQDFFNNLALIFPHPDYPLNIPLSETLVYLFLGNMNDQLVKIIFPLYFVGILAVLYFGIRRFASRTYSLLFTYLLASIPQFNSYATNGYLDLPLAYYYFISILFLFRWFEDKREWWYLLISASFVALCSWTKNEGLMYCLVNIILMSIFFISERKRLGGKQLWYLFIYLGVILLIDFPWLWLKKTAHLVNSDLNSVDINLFRLAGQFYKVGPIIYEFQKQFFGPKKWNILWPAVFFILIFNYKKAFSGIQKYITMSLVLIVSGYVFFYMASHVEIEYFLGKTWSRFLIHFLPVAVYWLASILKEDVKI